MVDRSPSEGWITFSALVLTVAGIINVICGVMAMYSIGPFTSENVPVGIYGWGLTLVAMGAAAVVAGLLVSRRSALGRIAGMTFAVLSLVSWAMWLGNNPTAATVAPVLALVVLFGLSVTKEYFR